MDPYDGIRWSMFNIEGLSANSVRKNQKSETMADRSGVSGFCYKSTGTYFIYPAVSIYQDFSIGEAISEY